MTEQATTFSDAALAVLDAMSVDPNATYSYEHLSGGFWWSDEFPRILSPEWGVVSHDYLYRYLLNFRRQITLGESEIESHPLWEQVVNHAPTWPGLLPERRAGRIVKRLRAAVRAAHRRYEKMGDECADADGNA